MLREEVLEEEEEEGDTLASNSIRLIRDMENPDKLKDLPSRASMAANRVHTLLRVGSTAVARRKGQTLNAGPCICALFRRQCRTRI